MKNWSTTKKIFVFLGILILIALMYSAYQAYSKSSKEAEAKRIANRLADVVQERKAADSVSGEDLSKAIRNNLANQPVSDISVKFYQS